MRPTYHSSICFITSSFRNRSLPHPVPCGGEHFIPSYFYENVPPLDMEPIHLIVRVQSDTEQIKTIRITHPSCLIFSKPIYFRILWISFKRMSNHSSPFVSLTSSSHERKRLAFLAIFSFGYFNLVLRSIYILQNLKYHILDRLL